VRSRWLRGNEDDNEAREAHETKDDFTVEDGVLGRELGRR
jgi:hypothetical protein